MCGGRVNSGGGMKGAGGGFLVVHVFFFIVFVFPVIIILFFLDAFFSSFLLHFSFSEIFVSCLSK